MSAIQPLKYLKRLSPQLRSLPIRSRTLKSLSNPMHLIMHLLLYFQLQTQMANCTRLHSTPEHFLPWNSIKMFTTKSYSQFLKPSNVANPPGRSLASYFPDVRPALLLAIAKHEFDPGQIFKIDPQMRDKPRDGHL